MAEQKPARLALLAVVSLTVAALLLNLVTLASGDYLGVVLGALACALAALLLIAFCWKRIGNFGRAIAILALLANAWTLLDILSRRLPALL